MLQGIVPPPQFFFFNTNRWCLYNIIHIFYVLYYYIYVCKYRNLSTSGGINPLRRINTLSSNLAINLDREIRRTRALSPPMAAAASEHSRETVPIGAFDGNK